MQKAVIGQQQIIPHLLVAIIAGGNTLLKGLPGLGKTQLVKALGQVLDLPFARIQFTPDLMSADITGTVIYHRQGDGNGHFAFQPGPLFANIILAEKSTGPPPRRRAPFSKPCRSIR